MRAHVVELATVAPRPTAVVAQTTTWDEFPGLWPKLLDEVYAVVRGRPELAPERGLALAGPREIYGHQHDDGRDPETTIQYLVTKKSCAAPGQEGRRSIAVTDDGDRSLGVRIG